MSCKEANATEVLTEVVIETCQERVAWWLATCSRKPKVAGSSPAASYVQR